ncbi:hypothetical protein LTR62_001866 [Meristemomyces frigidus]|uniref:Uncharacterized protein n=1 Tax=Meristemomyces frigidus TaxID=1508187 RepID=A0AAN7T8Q8_9PEZI|nr:hypothetical protein LTR62_001866 [Meristemomyces frigidus]
MPYRNASALAAEDYLREGREPYGAMEQLHAEYMKEKAAEKDEPAPGPAAAAAAEDPHAAAAAKADPVGC